MYFTREPVIETIISPKEGYKLVVRSSKGTGHEEYFVDALEIVSFGSALFYRSTERPKSFLLPVSDFEVLEVRETRMALKTIAVDRGIKIGGGRETSLKQAKEGSEKESEMVLESEDIPLMEQEAKLDQPVEAPKSERRKERKRFRKRKGKLEPVPEDLIEEEAETQDSSFLEEKTKEEYPEWQEESLDQTGSSEKKRESESKGSGSIFTALLPPPTTLISETISRYKDTPIFAGAFYSKEEKVEKPEELDVEEGSSSTEISKELEEEPKFESSQIEEEPSSTKENEEFPF